MNVPDQPYSEASSAALARQCGVFFNQLTEQGMSKRRAFKLTREWLRAIMVGAVDMQMAKLHHMVDEDG